jgi:hypothetical protein
VKRRRDRHDGGLSDRDMINASVFLVTANDVWEVHRTAAHEYLLEQCRAQQEEVRSGARRAVQSKIMKYVRQGLRRCAAQPDPIHATQLFLSVTRRVGRPRTPRRDMLIAAKVQRKVTAGASVEDACADVAPLTKLKFDQVKRIYFAVKCEEPVVLLIASTSDGLENSE